jgi:purine-cytosine permease-like protein
MEEVSGKARAAGAGTSSEAGMAGRIPVLFSDRLYRSYGEFLLTCATFGAASYAYLVGASLGAIGTTWIGLLGYAVGLAMGIAFVTFAVGMVSYRYGVDTVDASKIALGSRGSVVVLLGVMCGALGWGNVLLAMTARGVVELFRGGASGSALFGESAIPVVGVLLTGCVWLLLRRGAGMMEKAAKYAALTQILLALVLLLLVAAEYGLQGPLFKEVPAELVYTPDRITQLAYAVEFGFANALGLFPFIGGLARLVKHRRHLIGPAVMGYGAVGCAFVGAVGALAAAATGRALLSEWMTALAGPRLGEALMLLLLLANIGTMVAQFYAAGLAVQQFSLLSRWRWPVVACLILVPSLAISFQTQRVLDHVMVFLAYGGVLFVGVTSVLMADYFFLRGQQISVASLFARPGQGCYWFWGGVNWVAIFVIVFSGWLYLQFFDPVSLRTGGPFRLIGASIPVIVAGAAIYCIAMRVFVIKSGKGGYRPSGRSASPVEIEL